MCRYRLFSFDSFFFILIGREHSHQIKKGLILPQFQTGIPLLLTLSKQTCGAEKEERLLRVPSIQARGHLPIQNCQMDFHYIERVWDNWSHLKQGPPNVLQESPLIPIHAVV